MHSCPSARQAGSGRPDRPTGRNPVPRSRRSRDCRRCGPARPASSTRPGTPPVPRVRPTAEDRLQCFSCAEFSHTNVAKCAVLRQPRLPIRGRPLRMRFTRMRYRFGAFELDDGQYELRRGSDVVHVEPRVLEVLLFLIRNRDRVVTRKETVSTASGRHASSASRRSAAASCRCERQSRRRPMNRSRRFTAADTVSWRRSKKTSSLPAFRCGTRSPPTSIPRPRS